MLEALPDRYNWQMAFQNCIPRKFPAAARCGKMVGVANRRFRRAWPRPMWTPAVSRAHLDEILSVPVEMRTASNVLPVHAQISLQAVIRNWDRARQVAILQTKLRDLELAQLRMAAPLAVLTDGYRRALADYLGSGKSPAL